MTAEHEEPPRLDAPARKLPGPAKREFREGERVALSLRMTPALKRRLDAAAEQGGRSQSQEAELRLEQSFDRQGLLAEVLTLAYGPRVAGLVMLFGRAMCAAISADAPTEGRRAANRLAYDWTTDPAALNAALEAASILIAALRSSSKRPAHSKLRVIESIGQAVASPRFARRVLSKGPLVEEIDTIRRLIGHDLARRLNNVQAVRDALVSRIAIGEWTPNAPIPNESALASELGIKLDVMRKALDIMEREGLLVRRPGKAPSGSEEGRNE